MTLALWVPMDALRRYIRNAVRSLVARPGLTSVAVATIALGIGSSSAIYTMVDGVLLRPLLYDEPDRIVGFWGQGSWSRGELQFLRDEAESYAVVGGFVTSELTLTGVEEAQAVSGVIATPDILVALGVRPALGRLFRSEEEEPGRGEVAVLTDRLWRRVFGADRQVLGRRVKVNGTPVEIVGVLPPRFPFPSPGSELWLPLTMDPAEGSYRGGHSLDLLARLRPGISQRSAQVEIERLLPRLQEEFDLLDGFDKLATPPAVVPLHDQVVERIRPALVLLQVAVAVLLLVVCANVASLLLARGLERRRELAVRSALGARRASLAAQLLAESGALAAIGGVLGLLLAGWLVEVAVLALPPETPRLQEVSLDGRVVVFAVGLSLLTALLFGLAPAVAAVRGAGSEALAAGGRSDAASASHWRMRRGLVVVEVALATLLVLTGTLLLRSFLALLGTDPGFAPEVASFKVDLSASEHAEAKRRGSFYDQLFERLEAVAGIESVGANWRLPIVERGAYQILEVEGRPFAEGEERSIYWRVAAGDYFATMGVPLVKGRVFDRREREGSLPVCIVNRSMADRFWPEGGAIGRRIRNSMDDETWLTIVGVVGDVRHNGLGEASGLMMYRPLVQSPTWIRNLSVVVRSSLEIERLEAAVRREIAALDPDVPAFRFSTLGRFVADSLAQERLSVALVGLFAVISLGLALLGVFAVLSFAVGQRTAEFGIRMALGARAGEIVRLVLREGLSLVALGIALGIAAAPGAGRLLRGLLEGVGTADRWTYAAVPCLLFLAAVVACWLPSRRASRVEPIVALRHE